MARPKSAVPLGIISLRLPDTLRRRVNQISDYDGCTASETIRRAVQRYARQHPAPEPGTRRPEPEAVTQ